VATFQGENQHDYFGESVSLDGEYLAVGAAAGRYEVVWHGTNSLGAGVASGVYLYRIVSGSGYTETKRMTLLK
jgi:hypothetical protein